MLACENEIERERKSKKKKKSSQYDKKERKKLGYRQYTKDNKVRPTGMNNACFSCAVWVIKIQKHSRTRQYIRTYYGL